MVELYEYFFEKTPKASYLYLVMEYCEGGKIFNRYLNSYKKNYINIENEARRIFK